MSMYGADRSSSSFKRRDKFSRTGSSSWRLAKRKSSSGDSAASSTARKALRLAVKTRELLDVEFKYWDYHQGAYISIPTSPSIVLLTGIAEGDDMFQRTGRSIRKQSSFLQAWIQLSFTTLISDLGIVRMLILEDKASNGALPLASDIYSNVGTSITCFLNPDNMGERFKVISSVSVVLNAGGRQSEWVKEYRKLDTRTTFTGTTGGQTSCATGHLYLVFWAEVPPNVGIQPSMKFSHRVQYSDN